MKNLWKAFGIIGIIVLSSWTLPSEKLIGKAHWLIGTWENKSAQGTTYETWKKVSETEMAGKSYMLKNNDTVVFETIQLIERADNLYYIPNIKGRTTEFPLKTITENEMLFENLAHDFPQRISYKQTAPDALWAEISNAKGNKKEYFPMKRVK